jgi:phytoene dehydrogenase-like protein
MPEVDVVIIVRDLADALRARVASRARLVLVLDQRVDIGGYASTLERGYTFNLGAFLMEILDPRRRAFERSEVSP